MDHFGWRNIRSIAYSTIQLDLSDRTIWHHMRRWHFEACTNAICVYFDLVIVCFSTVLGYRECSRLKGTGLQRVVEVISVELEQAKARIGTSSPGGDVRYPHRRCVLHRGRRAFRIYEDRGR